MTPGDAITAPTFAEKLRELLYERGISLRELARRTTYDPGYLSNIANAHRPPSAHRAISKSAADRQL